jgi:hypothetical protein
VTGVKTWIVSHTAKTITIGWTPPTGQVGYMLVRDGSILIDGKRRFGLDPIGGPPSSTAKIGIPQDGKAHSYGVRPFGYLGEGHVATGADVSFKTTP